MGSNYTGIWAERMKVELIGITMGIYSSTKAPTHKNGLFILRPFWNPRNNLSNNLSKHLWLEYRKILISQLWLFYGSWLSLVIAAYGWWPSLDPESPWNLPMEGAWKAWRIHRRNKVRKLPLLETRKWWLHHFMWLKNQGFYSTGNS